MAVFLNTYSGKGALVTISSLYDLTGYTLSVETSSTSDFATVSTAHGTATASGTTVTVSFTAADVTALQSFYFRVKLTKSGQPTFYLTYGQATYIAGPTTISSSQVDSDGYLKQSAIAIPGLDTLISDYVTDNSSKTSNALRNSFGGVNNSRGLPAILARDGGGVTVRSYQYPTWGYGGSGVDKNAQSPTLLDLPDFGVSQMLWFPGTIGNYVTTPDTTAFSGNDTGNPRVMTFQVDIVTNEWDPIAGQSNYYLISKPGCWALRLTELGNVEVRSFDSKGGITLTSFATLPVKQRITLQVIVTPNDGGLCRADFNYSIDGGLTWNQFDDSVYGSRALGAYLTTSGSPLGILFGGNTTTSAFRGGLISCQVYMDSTLAGDIRPSAWAPGATSGTDSVGNVWTLQNPVPSNLVPQSCLAVASGEYITLTGTPGGQQLTTPGLYSVFSATGFNFDLSDAYVRQTYSSTNAITNTGTSPTSSDVSIYVDNQNYVIIESNGTQFQLGE